MRGCAGSNGEALTRILLLLRLNTMSFFNQVRRAFVAIALMPTVLFAQDFNIDIGPLGSAQPSATYAAAGQAGVWNAIQAPHTTPSTQPQPFDEMLVGLNGALTTVGLHQFGGQTYVDTPDLGLAGDDALLMNDALVANSLSLDTCLYLTGLQNGTYEVLSYMWMPNHPEVVHKSKFDFVPGVQNNTGAWTGGHVEGISYTRTIVNVTNEFMGPHMGLAPGQNPVLGGAVNGVQLRLLSCDVERFCSSTANSTGLAAQIHIGGTCSVEQNDFELSAGPVPNTVGLFFYSQTWVNGGAGTPFGNGLRCIGSGSPIFRMPASAISGSTLLRSVDYSALHPNGAITPGSTWHFQAWFRDPPAGGAQFDLSDGVTTTFKF